MINLLIRILHAAEAGTAHSEVSAAVAKVEDKTLIGTSQFHIFFEVFRQFCSWVFGGHVGDAVIIQAFEIVVVGLYGSSWLIVGR